MNGIPRPLARLFRNCLHLGTNRSLIAQSLHDLQRVHGAFLNDYFDRGETQLAPLLFWHLKQRGLAGLLVERLGRDLESRYQRNVARNAWLEQGLERVIERFNRAGIETLVLKGASVFTMDLSAYRNAFVLSDIDLLVRPADMKPATELLVADGYSLTDSQAAGTGLKQGLISTDRVTRIDLHSSLFWTAGGDYLDYGPADLWQRATIESFHGHRLAILSPEDQLCHRLVHDAIGHAQPVLTSSTCRLYYFAVLVDFYRDRIDWKCLLHDLRRKRSDRLFVAHLYYAGRELGLVLPAALDSLRPRARADLAVLDAVGDSTTRLANYAHLASLALLTSRSRSEQVRRLGQLLVRAPEMTSPRPDDTERGLTHVVEQWTVFVKILCLQLASLVFIGAAVFRHARRKEGAHVG
jgi:hypothetical protein